MHLSASEVRVLGALIEKEITTPEGYPLSLNSLQSAANQRSSRDPVLDLSDEEIRQALHSLQELALVNPTRDSRVPKYEHRARTVLNLRRDETALLCLLMLRGPQTPGELRSRADRLFPFEDLAAVVATLDRLAARPVSADPSAPPLPELTGPLTILLARQPGAREARYAHLLSGPVQSAPQTSRAASESPAHSMDPGTVTQADLAGLRAAIAALEQRVSALESSHSARIDEE